MDVANNVAPLVVYVDVDDTLIQSAGEKRIPMPAVIKHVKELHQQGAELYCWSAGGAAYARKMAAECAIEKCFVGFLPKPNVLVDDRDVSEWPRCVTIHPMNCDCSVEEYRQKLG